MAALVRHLGFKDVIVEELQGFDQKGQKPIILAPAQ